MPSFLELPRAANCEARSFVGECNGVFYVVPLRCGSWGCIRCAARKTTIWAHRVAAENPQRMVTFTRIGEHRDEIRLGLQSVIRHLRKHKIEFQYWGVVELHKSGLPHMHLVQKGTFIPKPIIAEACRRAGWGFSDVRQISAGWSAARYCAKHLCHSHGRRWDGRLVRFSRQFFTLQEGELEARRIAKEHEFTVVFGRADGVAERLRLRGNEVICGEMGLDWIMNEERCGDEISRRYIRNEKKGYSHTSPVYSSGSNVTQKKIKKSTPMLSKKGVKRFDGKN